MADINITFSRLLLAEGHKAVKKAFPLINLRKDAWVYDCGRDHWEFHGPKDAKREQFYWHGSASNAYEARYKGWTAWLRHMGVPEDAAPEAEDLMDQIVAAHTQEAARIGATVPAFTPSI